MAYSTQADILEQIDEQILIELTDDEDAGIVDTDAVDRAIADADAKINGYCGGRYSIPFDAVPPLIRACSVDLAICNLYARRRGAPEWRLNRCKEATATLKDISAGKVALDADSLGGGPGDVHMPEITSGARIFTRTTMRGF